MSIHINIDPLLDFQQPVLAELLGIWRGQANADVMPRWSVFDPVRIPPRILPHLYLIDGLDEKEPRPRWRLLGTHTTDTLGRDNTGKYFDEIYSAEDARDMSVPVLWVMEKRVPARITGRTRYADMDWLPFESIYLPYSGNSENVKRILGGVVYEFDSTK
ncbi:MAG: PAS domain-containing protein [Proteobacteria bacterium]|nr:PAS domain-containing protein [Pseudomonadota bacterium]